MIRQKVTITNPTGLHLRPAGMFCNFLSDHNVLSSLLIVIPSIFKPLYLFYDYSLLFT